jgi:hypothetical protein
MRATVHAGRSERESLAETRIQSAFCCRSMAIRLA